MTASLAVSCAIGRLTLDEVPGIALMGFVLEVVCDVIAECLALLVGGRCSANVEFEATAPLPVYTRFQTSNFMVVFAVLYMYFA